MVPAGARYVQPLPLSALVETADIRPRMHQSNASRSIFSADRSNRVVLSRGISDGSGHGDADHQEAVISAAALASGGR